MELWTQRCYPVWLWAADHNSLCSLKGEVGHQGKHEWLIFIPFNLQKQAGGNRAVRKGKQVVKGQN